MIVSSNEDAIKLQNEDNHSGYQPSTHQTF